jgi:hypothetical protein
MGDGIALRSDPHKIYSTAYTIVVVVFAIPFYGIDTSIIDFCVQFADNLAFNVIDNYLSLSLFG